MTLSFVRRSALAVVLLAAVVALSLAVGARPLGPSQVWDGLTRPGTDAYTVVHGMRLPRTLLGLVAGAALGLAGALMQSLTRNPLADPGLLGVNVGASAAVVTAISFLGVTSFAGYVWFAFAGAGIVAVLLYGIGGGRGATPARLALAGAALNAALYSYVSAVQLLDTASLDRMRFWTVGSLAAAQTSTVQMAAPFVLAGAVLATALARPLNALALGDDTARALGARPALVLACEAIVIGLAIPVAISVQKV
ncbi:iron ABC transporter permease, partial [Actinomadura logoneensis]